MPNRLLLTCLLLGALPASALPVVRLENPALPAPAPRELPESHASLFTDADLAPYLGTPEGQGAKKQFDAGHYREALAALQKLAPSVASRYLAALCMSHLGRDAEAAALFEAVAQQSPPLADRCHFHAAVAQEESKQLAEAERNYAAVAAGAVTWGESQLGLARVRRERHNLRGAIDVLAPVAARPSGSAGRDLQAEALVFTAQLAQAQGDKELVKTSDLKLWSEHPLAKISDAALVQARALGVKEPSNLLKVRRAEVLLDANRNDLALAALKPLLPVWKLPEPDACRTHFLYGKALRKQRQHGAALDALEPVIAQCGADPALRARALYIAGSSGSIVSGPRGIAAYTTLAHDYPDHAFADDALFFAADIEQKAGHLEAARALLLTLADVPAYRDGDFRPEGLFRLFWIARAQHHPEAGLAMLERIVNEYSATRPAEVERAEYWRGRTLAELDRHAAADEVLEALVRSHPTSYYALLARSRLLECHPVRAQSLAHDLARLPPPSPAAFEPGVLRADPHFRAAVELYRMGLLEEAADELVVVPREPLRHEEGDPLRLVVELLARAGNARAAQSIARTELQGELSGVPSATSLGLWMAAFPLAFRPEVQRSCGLVKVEPDLFQALIREESALDPHVISWAGAVGLSQLMPQTAKGVARDLKLHERIDLDSLQNPELNLRLGSAYVGQLLKKFSGNPALALAAYNAGSGAVGAWLRDRGTEDLDAFVEEIPIAETRGYVKRVLQTFNVYQLLYGHRAEARLPRATLSAPRAKVPPVAPPATL